MELAAVLTVGGRTVLIPHISDQFVPQFALSHNSFVFLVFCALSPASTSHTSTVNLQALIRPSSVNVVSILALLNSRTAMRNHSPLPVSIHVSRISPRMMSLATPSPAAQPADVSVRLIYGCLCNSQSLMITMPALRGNDDGSEIGRRVWVAGRFARES